MIYAIDVIGDCNFSWKAELFDSADRAYDFRASLEKGKQEMIETDYNNWLECEPDEVLSLSDYKVSEYNHYNYKYIVVDFDSLDEALRCYDDYVYYNFTKDGE